VENERSKEREKMKKPKRAEEWEESPLVSSKDFDAEFEDLDEEIIELDDEIVELPANGLEDDEEPAFDVEILDAEHPFDLKESEGKGESEEEFLFDDDLLKELPFFQDQPAEEEPGESTAKAQVEPKSEEPAPILYSDTGDEVPEAAPLTGEAEVLGLEEASPPPVSEPMAAPADQDGLLEDFVAQIETKLLDTVREVVEARLPEIVRAVLREEIERMKSDGESEA
jgi:hypothetical protein